MFFFSVFDEENDIQDDDDDDDDDDDSDSDQQTQASKTTELYLILFDQQTEGNADGNRRNWNGRKREKVSKAGAR